MEVAGDSIATYMSFTLKSPDTKTATILHSITNYFITSVFGL